MQEYIPTESERIEVLETHFYYEVNMIASATALWYALNYPSNFTIGYILQKEFNPTDNKVINNMCLEAVSIHTRNLIYFFIYKERGRHGKDKDALARDFLKDGEIWDIPIINSSTYPNLAIVKDRTNKEIAHLSYDRVPNAITNWNLGGVAIEIFSLIEVFIPKCKEKYVNGDTAIAITQLREFVRKLKLAKRQSVIP